MNGMSTKYIIILLLLLAAASCSRHSQVSDTLVHAEAVMEEHPDSALSILQAVPDSALVTDRARALHALLLSQALDKNYIDITSDSLINIAVEYYSKTNSDYYKAKSLYYRSRIEHNNQDIVNAITTLLNAESYALKVDDNILLGLIYRNIADICGEIYASKLQVEYAIKSYECFAKTTDRVYLDYAKLDVSRAYIASGDLQKSIKYASEISKSAEDVNDSSMVAYALLCIGNANFGLGNYEEAIKAYESSINIDSGKATPNLYKNLLDSYLKSGQEDVALLLKKRLEASEDSADMISYLAYSKLGEWKDAYNAVSQELKDQDKAFRVMMEQSIMKAVFDFQKAQQNEQLQKNKQLKTYTIIGAVFLIAVIVIMFLIVRLKRSEIENKAKDIVLLSEELRALKDKSGKWEDVINKVYSDKFDKLLVATSEFLDNRESAASMRIYSNNMEKELDRLCDSNFIKSVEKEIDSAKDGMITGLRNSGKFADEEIGLFVLMVLNLSPRSIAIITKNNIRTIYTRKRRLKEKLTSSELSNKDQYLRIFH